MLKNTNKNIEGDDNDKNINTNINNGLITKIWGPPLWVSLHCITFGYPVEPTEQHKKDYMEYFIGVGNILPCKYCRESYKQFITSGNTKLTLDVMKDRESFTKWFYLVHEAVNAKLGVDYGVTYKDVVKRYESYRATCSKKSIDNPVHNVKGCVVPLNKKAESYKIAEIKDCPIIPLNIAKEFVYYAKLRKLPEKDFKIINICDGNKKGIITDQLKNKDSELWENRNKECALLISTMRKNGIKSIEVDGKWKGLPTISELKLILMLSSNLTKEDLISVINKLPNKLSCNKKIYKLVK